MRQASCAGVTLIELLLAMAISAIVGSMIMQMVVSYQSRILVEVSRNDLQDRAERLLRFVSSDIRDAAFLLGPVPRVADGAPLSLVHDSLVGNPVETLPSSILVDDRSDEDDRLTIIKAVSFSPAITLAQPGLTGEDLLTLNRRPNRSPGSTRELHPAPEAINHLVLANHRIAYSVHAADLSLELNQALAKDVPVGTELLGVRVRTYLLEPFSGSNRLRRDNFTSRDIIDSAVDGLQFEYLLADGSVVDQPTRPQDIRGVRTSMLVRDLRPDQKYVDESIYSLGNRNYGPFHDHYRRTQVSQLVEVKNHGLQ